MGLIARKGCAVVVKWFLPSVGKLPTMDEVVEGTGMCTRNISVSVVSLLACFSGSQIFANDAVVTSSPSVTVPASSDLSIEYTVSSFKPTKLQEFQLRPQLNLWAYSGNNTVGEGQALIPLFGDASKVFYVLVEGNVAANNNSWLAGGGVGYRHLVNDKRIVGGYLLADYANTSNNNGFWIANPGVEMLGQKWDLNINGYIPFNRKKRTGEAVWADDLLGVNGVDVLNHMNFSGHSEYADKYQYFEEVGTGFGIEAGRVIPYFPKAKLFLGYYNFYTSDLGQINGGTARLTYALNENVALEVKNSYDNIKRNQIMFGVRLTLGGHGDKQKRSYGMASRLTDPVDNTFARLNGGSEVFSKGQYVSRGKHIKHDNLWFFRPTAANVGPGAGVGAESGAGVE